MSAISPVIYALKSNTKQEFVQVLSATGAGRSVHICHLRVAPGTCDTCSHDHAHDASHQQPKTLRGPHLIYLGPLALAAVQQYYAVLCGFLRVEWAHALGTRLGARRSPRPHPRTRRPVSRTWEPLSATSVRADHHGTVGAHLFLLLVSRRAPASRPPGGVQLTAWASPLPCPARAPSSWRPAKQWSHAAQGW